ncbi:hypothetical protein ENBRE01_1005 [Enteropsectra breve]|nr:hypothetical protein ENBRE01_1005 [Enteropsectra breve]
MRIGDFLPQFLTEAFSPVPFTSEYDRELSVVINWGGSAKSKFLLSEVFSSDMLKNKITRNNKYVGESLLKATKLSVKHQREVPEDPIETRCDFYELYLKILDGMPFEACEDLQSYSEKIKGCIAENTDAMKLLKNIDGCTMPEINVFIYYDPGLLFQMRSHLFVKINTQISPEMLEDLLDDYEFFIFDEMSATDIFLQFSDNRNAHLKIKRSTLFGINLHCLLQKQGMLQDFMDAFFNKPNEDVSSTVQSEISRNSDKVERNVFYSNFAANFASFKSLKFIEPLFRLIKIGYNEETNEPESVNFIEELSKMRYTFGPNNETELYSSSGDIDFEPVSFLNAANEKNPILRNPVQLKAILLEKIISNFDKMLCAVLKFLPQIKSLDLINSPTSRYNLSCSDKHSYFDMLTDYVLSDRTVVNNLAGFSVFGFTCLTGKAILFLKQCKFVRFGMRGICTSAEVPVLYLLFKKESRATIKKLHEKYGMKDNNLECDTNASYEEYNNLRNSVTHLTSNEIMARLAVKYYLIKNIKSASIRLQPYTNRRLFSNELDTLEEFSSYIENIEKIRPEPLLLDSLEIQLYPFGEDIRYILLNTISQQDYILFLCNDIIRRATPNYKVSNLVLSNSEGYRAISNYEECIGAFAVSSNILEIALYELCAEYFEGDFLNILEAFKFNGNKIVLKLAAAENFVYENECTILHTIKDYTLHMIDCIYEWHIHNNSLNSLIIRFQSLKFFVADADAIKKQVCDYILEQLPDYETPFDRFMSIEERITFEIA